MKNLLEKLSSYNLFNNLFPGIVFVILLKYFTKYNFIQDDIILGCFLYYFIGIVISRLGSLIIEPLLKKMKFVVFADYKDFITASKKDTKVELLSEVNNMYRTICSLIILLFLFKGFEWLSLKVKVFNELDLYILLLLLIILFLFSYKKQTKFVRERVLRNIDSKE